MAYGYIDYINTPGGFGGGGGGKNDPNGLDFYTNGNSGTSGFIILRYEVASTLRVPLAWGVAPPSSLTIEEGLPVSRSFDSVTGFPYNISFSVSSGFLPTGLSFNSSTGVLSGIPTVANESYSFTITASNGYTSVSQSYSGTVTAFAITSVTGAYSDVTSGGFRTIVWRGAGALNIASGGKAMEILVVGGGGGGGFDAGGGGGAAKVIYSSSHIVGSGTSTVVVGAGGAASVSAGVASASGSASSFTIANIGILFANGGGRGGYWNSSFGAAFAGGGGSWGGFGSSTTTNVQSSFNVLYGTYMQYSNRGGRAAPYYDPPGDLGAYFAMGGGGGSSTDGGDGITYQVSTTEVGRGGNGGTGREFFGTIYGDGGGGGSEGSPIYSRPQSLGGSGNGGKGQSPQGSSNMNAVAHTGSGGGGSSNSGYYTMLAGNGSAGIVIVRFAV